jgi:hypothetical protein
MAARVIIGVSSPAGVNRVVLIAATHIGEIKPLNPSARWGHDTPCRKPARERTLVAPAGGNAVGSRGLKGFHRGNAACATGYLDASILRPVSGNANTAGWLPGSDQPESVKFDVTQGTSGSEFAREVM